MAEMTTKYTPLDRSGGSSSHSQEDEEQQRRRRPYSSLSDAADAPKDAGTLFVLESKGTWMHAGYHLTTAIAGPSLLSLPYAFSFLGWAPGLLALTICGLVSSYAYCLLSQVLDDCASKGHRFYRFRELSQFVIGKSWTNCFVTPVQFGVCFVTVVGAILAGGFAVKVFMYKFIDVFLLQEHCNQNASYIPGSECKWNNPIGSIRGNIWGSDDSSCTATIISFLAVYKSGVSITLLDLQPLCYCWLCFGRLQ
jgi:amino acid permease